MFQRLGRFVSRHPWTVIAAWVMVALGVFAAGRRYAPRGTEPDSFLPPDSEQRRALSLMVEAFPELANRSQVVTVVMREGGLEPRDFEYLARLADAARAEAAATGRRWTVLSPTEDFLRRRLVSADGKVALLVTNLQEFYANQAASEAVGRIEALAASGRPDGLRVELTGAAAGARDYARTLASALRYTKWVTVASVLSILLLVYRSPVAAILPIVGIGICTWMALQMLNLFGLVGLYVTDMERMFTVVLLYGAGTDFAMFWLARYREEWAARGRSGGREAAAIATARVGPAIVASAGTTILGLLSLVATRMIPTQNAGKVLGAVLCWAPLAGTTLIPALVCLLGRAVFWPRRLEGSAADNGSRAWRFVGGQVVQRPGAMLALGAAVLMPAAIAAGFLEFRYDTLSELPPDSSSQRGAAIAHQHFPPGVLYPMTVLIRSNGRAIDDARAPRILEALSRRLLETEGVAEVYSLTQPLGRGAAAAGGLGGAVVQMAARRFYVSSRTAAVRLEVVLEAPPFSAAAMRAAQAVQAEVEAAANGAAEAFGGSKASVHMLGATPYILEVRRYMSGDQWRVWIGATIVIWLTVALLVRRVGLSAFMVAATLLTYAATLGLSHEFFTHVTGGDGLDYKVKLFLFVIIVAVGQDYNIFLVSRLRQEVNVHGDEEGVRRAVVRTGGVISGCGVIMAATLGSLWVGRLDLLRQLGFALALGMLIDTFVVRPLLVPSFWLCARRRSRSRREGPAPGGPLAGAGHLDTSTGAT